jgi:hypothetical protein
MAKTVGADAYVECSALNMQGLRSVFETVIKLGLGIFRRANKSSRMRHGKDGECVAM